MPGQILAGFTEARMENELDAAARLSSLRPAGLTTETGCCYPHRLAFLYRLEHQIVGTVRLHHAVLPRPGASFNLHCQEFHPVYALYDGAVHGDRGFRGFAFGLVPIATAIALVDRD